MTNFTVTGDWTAQGGVSGTVTFTPSTGGGVTTAAITAGTLAASLPIIAGSYLVSFAGISQGGLAGYIPPFAFASPSTATTVNLNSIAGPAPTVRGTAGQTKGSPVSIYIKPAGGIPLTDLSPSLQSALALGSSAGIHPQSVVTFGDSIVQHGYGVSGITTYFDERAWDAWANAFLGWRFRLLYNAGISGNTLVQMLARINADVLAHNPSWVWMDGGVNDITSGAQYTDIIASFQSIFGILQANNIKVVCLTITPNSSYTTGQNAIRGQVNQWLREYGATSPNVLVVDVAPWLQDPAGNGPLAGYSYDGLHPTTVGAMAMGYAVYKALDKVSVPRSLLTAGTDPTNILGANAMMAGSAGAVAGLATGWKNADSGGASTYSKIARTDGILGELQRVVTPSGNNYSAIYLTVDPTTGFAAGDTIYAAIEVAVSSVDLAPTADQQRIMVQLTCFDNTSTAIASGVFGYGYVAPGYSQVLPLNYSATIRTPNIVVPSGTVKVRLILWGFGGGTRDWSRPVIRKFS